MFGELVRLLVTNVLKKQDLPNRIGSESDGIMFPHRNKATLRKTVALTGGCRRFLGYEPGSKIF